MRITGGAARGIPLGVPKGDQTRPATDRDREALFSSLGSWIEGKAVLDLFAGTGAYGLEALSRGADSVTWVEKAPQVVQLLKKNLEAVQKAMNGEVVPTRVLGKDAFRSMSYLARSFDLVIVDPPYQFWQTKEQEILTQVLVCLKEDVEGTVVLESPEVLPSLKMISQKCRRVGKNVWICQVLGD
ncbi:MAG: RsmD family RNA methyltransferase [Opitutales bacterium]|nr:RsmD family RNA methyltransferase [Opitutales bacterium]MCH8541380.1 RsmD family RNA methyltransferase [Opitutales bacterium]